MKDDKPKKIRRKSSRCVFAKNSIYSGSFKSPMSWSIGGNW
jgi:hypothetical protein